ncbi:hypothetical protein QBC38DRAFT_369727 [Podospora fimiseda]|uniref:Uncharacterized protein n=1 Tax=Podospora fimiseda TaxID=252190 RepID=A0AAN7BK32_9PEZI|nr:hypothetical protein QBC38DRAFT_369727 [Podospora fimiseda]
MSATAALAARHSAIRGLTRVKPPTSHKIKTGSLDASLSEKALAMASSDWRSSGLRTSSVENNRGSSSTASSAFDHPPDEMGSDDLPPLPDNNKETYHRPLRPSEDKPAWEMALSIPSWKLPSTLCSSATGFRDGSSSGSFGLGRLESSAEHVTMVQLKNITPLLVPLNGENIELPNQLCLDITPIHCSTDWEEISLGESEHNTGRPVIGALRKMTARTRVRRLTSEESYDTLDDLRQIMAHERSVIVPRSIEEEPQTEKSSEDRTSTDSGVSGFSDFGISTESQDSFNSAISADQDRFKILLKKIGLAVPQAQYQSRAQTLGSKAQILDPAIIAAKTKENFNIKATDAQRSDDSGYASFQFGRNRLEKSTSSESTSFKKLNPAAAEFKSVARGHPVPVISPKKIMRTPLTNIFPHALDNAESSSHPRSPSKGNGYPPPPVWSPSRRPAPAEQTVPMVPIPVMLASRPLPVIAPPPLPPLFGAEGKINRPYFPVTQKPRDHDPIKQQMYESYLEWRKANEPGYHMKCKMRQAHRVVRQYQSSAVGDDKTMIGDANAEWKAIAEKAKAAASAIAAATEKEKKTREQLVREELKAKIQRAALEASKKEPHHNETSISAAA